MYVLVLQRTRLGSGIMFKIYTSLNALTAGSVTMQIVV